MLVIFNYLLKGPLTSIKAYKTVSPLNPGDSYLINLEEFNALLVDRIKQGRIFCLTRNAKGKLWSRLTSLNILMLVWTL